VGLKQSWDLDLNVDRVLAAQGADPVAIRLRHPGLVAAAERALREGMDLIAPKATRRTLTVTARDERGVHCAGAGRLSGAYIERQLCEADGVVVALCTIGGALEARVSAALADDAVLALALDGVGTAAVDALAGAVCGEVAAEAQARGWRATSPFSPGMMGWSLADGQDQVFSLVDAGSVGVTLTASRLMVPRKSVSMVIGIGPHVAPGGRSCDLCNMKETCRYRTRTGGMKKESGIGDPNP
jgi:hypothetical protein